MTDKMNLKIEYIQKEKLKPYAKNAKTHPAEQVEQIKKSIQEFGFNDPIAVWGKNEIVEGHGRLLAVMELDDVKTVPVIRLDNLTDEQRRAYMLAHNKLTMNSPFELDILQAELDDITDIDMSLFGFDLDGEDWFEGRERNDTSSEEGNDEYNEFLDKFKPKKTTDDCYTPDIVYDAIADWVASEYKLKRDDFIRPFFPGGDYQKNKYPEGCVVVDNPPFSILAEIIRWYSDHGIRFFCLRRA